MKEGRGVALIHLREREHVDKGREKASRARAEAEPDLMPWKLGI